MASISGTNVAAKIVPFTTEDQFATHVSTYGQGGWHEVADNTARDAISADRKIAGMAVFVTSDKKLYTLNADLTTWSEVESGKVDDVKVNDVSVVSNKIANITVPTKISDLTDIELTDITDGQTLVYDSSSSKWVNGNGGVSASYDSTTKTITFS